MRYLKKYRVIALLIALVAVWSPDVWAQAAADVVEVDSVVSETFNSTQSTNGKTARNLCLALKPMIKKNMPMP
ncbi:MAG: hypothetical protein IJ925_06895 [Muribaculaceae bacterium]|nr:hypothetical protein [Muribaculaceae bacterium]